MWLDGGGRRGGLKGGREEGGGEKSKQTRPTCAEIQSVLYAQRRSNKDGQTKQRGTEEVRRLRLKQWLNQHLLIWILDIWYLLTWSDASNTLYGCKLNISDETGNYRDVGFVFVASNSLQIICFIHLGCSLNWLCVKFILKKKTGTDYHHWSYRQLVSPLSLVSRAASGAAGEGALVA